MTEASYLRSALRKLPFTVTVIPPGCGASDATMALSVHNLLSDAKRDLIEQEIRYHLSRPEIWDARVTLEDVQRGVAYLEAKGWANAVQLGFDPRLGCRPRLVHLVERHPKKLTGRELKRDPMDPQYDNLIEMASFQ